MTTYIYARVSSTNDRQSTDRQVKALTEQAKQMGYDVAGIYEEHISGAKTNKERKVLTECLTRAKENGIDLILFSEMSRCGRAIWEVLETIKKEGAFILSVSILSLSSVSVFVASWIAFSPPSLISIKP